MRGRRGERRWRKEMMRGKGGREEEWEGEEGRKRVERE